MTRARRLGPLLALLLLAGCGTQRTSAEEGPAPLPDETYQRVLAQGVDPDLVHAIELPGFELAEQSAGVLGDADYGATYVPVAPPYTSEVHLRVAGGDYDDARCASEPLAGAVASCTPDDRGWYRTGGGRQEYVLQGDGYVLAVSGPAAVDRADLVAAALGARRQDGGAVTPATPATPVPRGDLPTTGDGAPVDPHGTEAPGG